jgi:tetratricopeptide (TPR) repeat protein
MALYRAGRIDLAEQQLRMHLSEEPGDGHAHSVLAAFLSERGALHESIAEAREGVRLAPRSAFGHAALGEALSDAKEWREGIAELREAIRIAPGDASYYAHLAHVLSQTSKADEALELAEAGLRIDPLHVGCLNERGLALLWLRRVAEAREAIGSALVSAPDSANLHANLGVGLLHQGRQAEAVAEMLEALRLNPSNTLARSNLEVARRAGRGAAGGRAFRAVSWWMRHPARWQLGVVAAFAVGGILWPGFLEPAAILLAMSFTTRLADWSRQPPEWRRRIATPMRPLANLLVVIAAFGPFLLSLATQHAGWGMGAGIAVYTLLVIAVADPTGLLHWLSIGLATVVAAIGILSPVLGLPPNVVTYMGFLWFLLYLPDRTISKSHVESTDLRSTLG